MDGGVNKTRRIGDRIRSIFKEKFKIKNNFRGIEPLDTSILEPFKGKKGSKKKKGGGSKKKKGGRSRKRKKKMKKKLKRRNKESQGAKFLRNNVMYLFPTGLRIVTDMLVNDTPSSKFDKNGNAVEHKKHDETWLFKSSLEFCNIWLAFFMALVLEASLGETCYKTVSERVRTFDTGVESTKFKKYFFTFCFPIFAPTYFFSFLVDSLPRVKNEVNQSGGEGENLDMHEIYGKAKNVLEKSMKVGEAILNHEIEKIGTESDILKVCKPMFLNTHPNLNLLIIFIAAFCFCSFFMEVVVKMFLNSLSYKTSTFMYFFIGVAFLKMFVEGFIDLSNQIGILTYGVIFFIIVTLIQALICFFLAPVAQFILFLELCVPFFSGCYLVFLKWLPALFSNEQKFTDRQKKTSDSSFWSMLDSFFLNIAGNDLRFLGFVFLLFFMYKGATATFMVKKFWLMVVLSIINAIGLLCFGGLLYHSFPKDEKVVFTQNPLQ